jgi:hypothetical protein
VRRTWSGQSALPDRLPSRHQDFPQLQTMAKRGDWRRQLRRSIGWMLLVKLAALIALWALFFSPSDRPDVTPERVHEQLLTGPEEEHADD